MAIESRGTQEPSLKRFKIAVQKNRVYMYLFGGVMSLLFYAAGMIASTPGQVLIIVGLAITTALLFQLFYRYNWQTNLDPLWIFFDAMLITIGVHYTGGADSVFFPWYLANVSGAAFALGLRWAIGTALLDTAAYLGLLLLNGDVAWWDPAFFHHALLMLFLFAATLFFLRGTTDLQRKQRQIKKLKESESRKVAELTRLTSELDSRTRDLADANLKLKHADTMKSQFLANMSHELRTPLNSIIGFSEILLTRLAKTLPEKYLRFLNNINTSGQHLLSIINDLLDLSKIEAGKLEVHPEKVSFESIAQGVCTVMKGITEKHHITIEISLPEALPPLEADPVKVKQILYNLVSNAVKFSPDGETVTVSARHVPAGKSPLHKASLEVAVTDRGIGIDPKDHETIFQEFQQVDNSSTRQFQGTGLGLALVKRFVELHHGIIHIESAVDEGSTFIFTLPVRYTPDEEEPTPPPMSLVTDSDYPRVLIVEDDPTAYESISRELAVAHFIPVWAKTGKEAVRMASEVNPAAITLDIILPDMDGWDVLKLLKNNRKTSSIPVVIVSMLDNRDLALALGAEDYFIKPIQGERLVERLSSLLPPEEKGHPRILLIDDDPDLHEMIDGLLSDLPYRIDHAFSGEDGLKLIEEKPPSLILLDLMMEEMDGFEVAARLRSNPKTAYLPVVVLTAKELTAEDTRRLSGKINALVQKGKASPSQLVEVIGTHVRRHSQEARYDAT